MQSQYDEQSDVLKLVFDTKEIPAAIKLVTATNVRHKVLSTSFETHIVRRLQSFLDRGMSAQLNFQAETQKFREAFLETYIYYLSAEGKDASSLELLRDMVVQKKRTLH